MHNIEHGTPRRVGAGGSKVVELRLKEVPDPELSLNPFGLKSYFDLCARLMRRNNLTISTRGIAENLALQKQAIEMKLKAGKSPGINAQRDVTRLMLSLRLIEDDAPLEAANDERPPGRFATLGFSNAPKAPSPR